MYNLRRMLGTNRPIVLYFMFVHIYAKILLHKKRKRPWILPIFFRASHFY